MKSNSRAPTTLVLLLVVLSLAAVTSVAFANVIRVMASEDAAVGTRAVLFSACWIVAVVWAFSARERVVLLWLGIIAVAALLIAVEDSVFDCSCRSREARVQGLAQPC